MTASTTPVAVPAPASRKPVRDLRGFWLAVLPPAIIRDRVGGDKMARMMSVIFVIFLMVRQANRLIGKKEEVAGPTEVELLTEIRDALKK